MKSRFLLCVLLLSLLVGCYRASPQLEPMITPPPLPREIARENRSTCPMPSSIAPNPFPPLSAEELASDWGKELKIALAFAKDFDLYRAITSFKRALFLIPADKSERRLEIEYDIALCYYLGRKYEEVVYAVESTELIGIDSSFCAFSDMLLILYDSYQQLCFEDKAEHIFSLIQKEFPDLAERLNLLKVVCCGDLDYLREVGQNTPKRSYLNGIVDGYCCSALSVRKAEFLNATLPGSGYWYVGQRATAVTALLVNSLFIAASAHFFLHDNLAAGVIFLSLESGWYFGGIYGAGLAAKSYNEQLYQSYVDKITLREQFFPCLMVKYTF